MRDAAGLLRPILLFTHLPDPGKYTGSNRPGGVQEALADLADDMCPVHDAARATLLSWSGACNKRD